MVMTRTGKLKQKVVTKSKTDTSVGLDASREKGQVQHGPTMNELRATIAEEVVRAFNLSMPTIFEHVKEITHKVIEDKVVIKKDEEQVKENTREDGVVVEKEDFSDCMPEFNGLCDPIAALRWIHEIENIFKAIKCADEEKVVYAIAKLRSEALSWWDRVKDTSVPTAWNQFKEMFKDKFCPIRMVMQLEEELLTFKQGSKTVQEYTARFVEMAKYAEHQVATEGRKMERFIRGLRTDIREIVSTKNLSTFQEAVEAAQEVEKEIGKHLEDRNTYSIKRIREGSESRMCTKCGKMHEEGDCRYGSMGRHKRGKHGHLA
ncbi:zinc finger, CCHC-type, retrotransposon gag domain protein [Tanacetum coccineum]